MSQQVAVETPDCVYGRLLEAVHVSGYTASRACDELEWLLEEDRWKSVGQRFASGADFLASINLSEFKWAADRRKKLVQGLAGLEGATQRSIGKALGVSVGTVNADLVQNRTPGKQPTPHDQSVTDQPVQNRTFMQSGTEAAEQIRRQAESLSGKPHVSYATGDFEWYSPAEYIGAARVVLGEIDLDPASTETANTVVKACRIFTAEQDGLTQTWTGRVWMNPPYASGLIDRFVEKLIASFECGDVPAAVVLVNNATETVWFQSLAQTAAAICFPAKRIRFAHPDRGTPGQPFQGQAVLYLGKEAAKFRSAFRAFGFIVEPSERDNGNQLGYFGPIPTQAERTNVNELHAQLRAMWPAGQDVLAKSSCVTSVWR